MVSLRSQELLEELQLELRESPVAQRQLELRESPVPQRQLELRQVLDNHDCLVDCRCDSGTHSDVQYYHPGVPWHNQQGRPNSTGNDIEDLVAMAPVSIGETLVVKGILTCHMITT